jgi:hypothetical protein
MRTEDKRKQEDGRRQEGRERNRWERECEGAGGVEGRREDRKYVMKGKEEREERR